MRPERSWIYSLPERIDTCQTTADQEEAGGGRGMHHNEERGERGKKKGSYIVCVYVYICFYVPDEKGINLSPS